MKVKITKKTINELELPEKNQNFIWDSELKGFGIRISPKGIAYIAQGRVKGKTRRVTIGKHGVYTPEQARKRAMTILQDLSQGVDPSIEKKRNKVKSVTLQEVVADYKKNKKTRDGHPLKETTKKDIDRHLNTTFAEWKEKPIADITREKVLNLYRASAEKSVAQANQGFRVLRALYNWARATSKDQDGTPVLPENPVQTLTDLGQWGYVPARKTRVSTFKVGEFWHYLHEARNNPGQRELTRIVCDFVAFVLLTGCRFTEAASLTWDRVDLENNTWSLPDPKNRNPVVFPLSTQAKKILENVGSFNDYVFSSRAKSGHVTDCRGLLKNINGKTGEDVTAHDLRRTFRAIAGECGIEFWKCKLLMNHKMSNDVTLTHYTDTTNLTYLQPDIQKIGDWIERQGKIAASDKVVDLEQARQAS